VSTVSPAVHIWSAKSRAPVAGRRRNKSAGKVAGAARKNAVLLSRAFNGALNAAAFPAPE